MNWTALKWTLEIVSALAALASALDAGLTAEIKTIGPAKLRAGDTIEWEIVASGTDTQVHYAPKLVPLDAAAKSAMADRKVIIYTEKNRSKGRISCYEGLFSLEATVTTETDDARASVQIDVPRGGDCPPCPAPTPCPQPEPGPGPTPIPPEPPTPVTPVLPIPNADGKFKIGNKVARIVQDVYRAKIAGHSVAEQQAIHILWAGEVEAAAATSDVIAAQIAAGTLKGITEVKIDVPKTQGWAVATAALSQLVLETYKANSSVLKLTVTGGISAADEWAELIREISGGIRAAK